MTETDVLERLSALFALVFQAPGLIATAEMTARDVAGWDSLTHIDMIIAVEEAFAIRLSTREVTELKTVGDLVRIILTKTGGGPA